MTNVVVLVGRLTHEPELEYTAGQGHAVVNFALAVDRDYKNREGERETDFIPVRVWRKQAELCAEYLSKGSQVSITGRLEVNSFETDEGDRRKSYKVVAENVQFLDSRKAEEPAF